MRISPVLVPTSASRVSSGLRSRGDAETTRRGARRRDEAPSDSRAPHQVSAQCDRWRPPGGRRASRSQEGVGGLGRRERRRPGHGTGRFERERHGALPKSTSKPDVATSRSVPTSGLVIGPRAATSPGRRRPSWVVATARSLRMSSACRAGTSTSHLAPVGGPRQISGDQKQRPRRLFRCSSPVTDEDSSPPMVIRRRWTRAAPCSTLVEGAGIWPFAAASLPSLGGAGGSDGAGSTSPDGVARGLRHGQRRRRRGAVTGADRPGGGR